MTVSDQRDPRLVIGTVAGVLAALIVLWVLYLVRDVLILVYVSTLLAIGFSPAIHWFEHRRVGWLRRTFSRGAAILVFYIVCLAITGVLLLIIVPPFVRQMSALWQAMPADLDRVQQILVTHGWLQFNWTWGDVLEKIPSPELAVTSLVGAFESVVGALAGLATIVVLPYYLLVEANDIQDGFLRLLPADRREPFERITNNVTIKVGAWLRSQLLLCVIIGTMASTSFFLIGVPYFYVLGLIAGLCELVPVIGILLAACPALIAGWAVSTETMLLVAGYFVFQQVVESYVLVPRLMQAQVGVSAVTVIIALLVGTDLLGIVGALLAVPTAAIVQVLLREHLEGRAR